ncbi:unnamed protein product, partial [Ectocarpus sp. 12 AP-2014]
TSIRVKGSGHCTILHVSYSEEPPTQPVRTRTYSYVVVVMCCGLTLRLPTLHVLTSRTRTRHKWNLTMRFAAFPLICRTASIFFHSLPFKISRNTLMLEDPGGARCGQGGGREAQARYPETDRRA